MSFAIIVLVVVYFMFGHKRVLSHFGLTERDNKLMWIGLLVPNLLILTIQFVLGAITGQFLLMPLVFMILMAICIYCDYSSL